MEVSRLTTCSVRAAREVTSLMVEHGINPLVSPSFWLTMVRLRPLVGSTTTTLPFMLPRAATAERLTARSSPSTFSPSAGSTAGSAFRTGLRAGADFLVADEGLDFLIWALAGAAFWSKPTRSSGKRTNPFICGAFRQLTDSLSAIAEPLVNGQSATLARGSREPPTWPSDPYPLSLRRSEPAGPDFPRCSTIEIRMGWSRRARCDLCIAALSLVHEESHDGFVQGRHVVLSIFVDEDGDSLGGAFSRHCASIFIIGGRAGAW